METGIKTVSYRADDSGQEVCPLFFMGCRKGKHYGDFIGSGAPRKGVGFYPVFSKAMGHCSEWNGL